MARDAAIGLDSHGRLLFVVHVEFEGEYIASFLLDPQNHPKRLYMLNETLKKRLTKTRPQTSITLRIPVDVVESLKAIAPRKGYNGYQTLLKAYISDGLRRDEAANPAIAVERLTRALKKRGVSEKVLDAAMKDLAA